MSTHIGPYFKKILIKRKFKAMNNKENVKEAFDIIKEAIQNDDSYAYTWHANISMALLDSMPETFWMPDKKNYHKIVNQAATTFMSRCWEVKTSADMLEDKEDV